MAFPRRAVAIVGIGETDLGRLGRSPIQLAVDASLDAIADAGIDRDEIDGLLSLGSIAVEDERDLHRHHIRLAEQLGLRRLTLTNTSKLGGAALAEGLREASLYIEAGILNTVLIVGADSYRSMLSRDGAQAAWMAFHDRELEGVYGHTAPSHWAINAQKYMEKYGLNPEDLALIAVTERKWAALNPKVRYKEPLTVEAVLASRMISSPLRLYDCSRSLDGGGAIIVTAATRARAMRRHPPVYVLGVGSCYEPYYFGAFADLPESTMAVQKLSCDRAYDAAGVTPADVDVAFPYDGFSVMVWMFLEAMGLAEPGRSHELIRAGRCDPGGDRPINTHGGALNYGLPAFPAKFFHISEMTRQLRHECGVRQVKDAEVAMFHGVSGVGGVNASLILSNA